MAHVGPLPARQAAGQPVPRAPRVLRREGRPAQLPHHHRLPARLVARRPQGHPRPARPRAQRRRRRPEPPSLPAQLHVPPHQLHPQRRLPQPACPPGSRHRRKVGVPQDLHLGRVVVHPFHRPAPHRQPEPHPRLRPLRALQRGVLALLRGPQQRLPHELQQPRVHDRDDGVAAPVDARAQQRDSCRLLSGIPLYAATRHRRSHAPPRRASSRSRGTATSTSRPRTAPFPTAASPTALAPTGPPAASPSSSRSSSTCSASSTASRTCRPHSTAWAGRLPPSRS